MTLTKGQVLSFYEILDSIGAGAMGEVYRARDTRLEREVAIKVLPEELAGDEERLRRFEREAKTLASLNHSNVAQVFGIDQVEGTCFMAMELVPGEDLARRLSRGPLPVAEAVDVCRQIAEGLEAAHETGVIHRDLKPANVVITPEGKVKVLDFGLAKPIDPNGGASSTTDSVLSTVEGRLLGTPTYMAPEQARGKPIDKRVDLWAFGCVLFECLTGRRAFEGETLGVVLASVLEKEPDWTALPASTPERLRELLERCLRKEPRQRMRDVGDARIFLEELGSGALASSTPTENAPKSSRLWGPLLAGLAVAAVVFAIAKWKQPDAPAATYTLRPLTASSGLVDDPNWSPRSESIAFARQVSGSLDLFVMPLAGGEAVLLAGGPGDESLPRWSPDGQTIAYLSTLEEGCPIYLIPSHSGDARPLYKTRIPALEIADVSEVLGDHPWAEDGASLLVSRVTDSGQLAVFRVDTNDSSEIQLTFPPQGAHDGSATFSFDWKRIAFARTEHGRTDLWIMSATGKEQRPILADGFVNYAPSWRPDGRHLVYSSKKGGLNKGLWEIDEDTGATRQLTFETRNVLAHTVSASDQVAYSSFWHDTFLHVVDVETGATAKITDHAGDNGAARYSHDGKSIVYESNRDGDLEIWVHSLTGKPERQITFDPGSDQGPDWSPDGEQLVFVSARDGAPALYVSNSDGGNQRPLLKPTAKTLPSGGDYAKVRWSPDGELVGFVVSGKQGPALWCVRPDGTDLRQLVDGVIDFDWYRDSRRVICTSSTGNADELFAHRLETGEQRTLWKGNQAELNVAPDGLSVAFATGAGHQSMSLARLFLEPPSDEGGLPTARAPEPEILIQAKDRWHVHLGGWSSDSKQFVYIRDEDYSNVYELVERR